MNCDVSYCNTKQCNDLCGMSTWRYVRRCSMLRCESRDWLHTRRGCQTQRGNRQRLFYHYFTADLSNAIILPPASRAHCARSVIALLSRILPWIAVWLSAQRDRVIVLPSACNVPLAPVFFRHTWRTAASVTCGRVANSTA